MARNPEHQPAYDAVNLFKENCLVGNRSLLWPERSYWTLENLNELKQRFIEHDMSTDQTFQEKFLIQLGIDNPILWGIACDLFFVHSLPSKSMRKQSKIAIVEWAANNGKLSLPNADQNIWNALESGFVVTGIQYHRKVGQIAFLILLAIGVKEDSNPERIFESPQAFQNFVKHQAEKGGRSWDRAPDMRSALSYLLFPDYFECIISMHDKHQIADYYQKKLHLAPVNDLDQAIYQIRQKLSPDHDQDGKPFHFYGDLKSEWQPKAQLIGEKGAVVTPAVVEPPSDVAALEVSDDPDALRVSNLLIHTRNVILYGPPGTGKTYIARQVARQLIEHQLGGNVSKLDAHMATKYKESDFVKWVTFHQSYAYEDFIEGWRPLLNHDDDNRGSFEIRRGVFKTICDKALSDPKNNYVLVIDEINRGNIAKIMGELITLIEDDKRGFAVDLPYSGDSFCVPANLYLIGTMNTADRSIALLDVALRRRFAFAEMMPRPDLLAGVQVALTESVDLGILLTSLNKGVRQLANRDLQIGHSYFLKVKGVTTPEDKLAKLEFVWNYQVLPLLNEYFYNRPEQLIELLRSFETSEDSEYEVVLGAVGDFGKAWGEDLLAGLAGVIEKFEPDR